MVALGHAIVGPGGYSVDSTLGIALPQPATLVVGVAAALLRVAIVSSRRQTEESRRPKASRRQWAAPPELPSSGRIVRVALRGISGLVEGFPGKKVEDLAAPPKVPGWAIRRDDLESLVRLAKGG
jgi:hypothetical protein